MKRVVLLLGLLTLLSTVSFGKAELVKPRRPEIEQRTPGYVTRSYIDTFKGNARALAIASGQGRTCMGMYVFDEHGNCVACDDLTSPNTCDDLVVEWIPSTTAIYDVQIRNAGLEMNEFELALR